MIEKWTKWEPVMDLPDKIFLEKLIDDKKGLTIEFNDELETTEIIVNFENSVVSYRNSDEGKRLNTLEFLNEKYGKIFYSNWSFFKVNNSLYLKWLNDETYDMYTDYNIEHYVFLTSNDIVDVLSSYPPKIRIRSI